jgi:hypothetical protein
MFKQELESCMKKVEKGSDGSIIKASKVMSGHESTPRKYESGGVIDHVGKDGKVETRTFYNTDGIKSLDITNHDHGNPKKHPYGKHGEHAHDYEWDSDGKLKNRTTRDITDTERKENDDIL